jgi:hypothetical protein
VRVESSNLQLETVVSRLDRQEIDLQPDYQRGEVWDRRRQRRLVDTIIRGWYVPAVHVVRDSSSGADLVLDGQQRLRTILRFFESKVAIDGRMPPLDSEVQELHGLTFRRLPPEVQRRLQRFPLTVVTLFDFEPSEPSELFFRLNQQYALTPSEKRNALYGPARDQIKRLVTLSTSEHGFSRQTVGFDNGRLGYDDVLSRFCILLDRRSLAETVSNTDIEGFYRKDSFESTTIADAATAVSFLGSALRDAGGVRLNKATLLSWLIFAHRQAVRQEHLSSAFLNSFETNRLHRARGLPQSWEPAAPFLAQFSDRAAYRVADQASVLLRDLALSCTFALVEPTARPDERLTPLVAEARRRKLPEAELLAWSTSNGWYQLP